MTIEERIEDIKSMLLNIQEIIAKNIELSERKKVKCK